MDNNEIIAQGSQSFARAAKLFAPDVRTDALRLYAWCRHCDDVIDGQALGHDRQLLTTAERTQRLQEIEAATRAALAGTPADHPRFAALQEVTSRHAMPPEWPLDVIEGFRLDVTGATYRTLPETLRYCYHVAGVVGLMMARIMGARDADTLDRACDLGLAFQLTNIARDLCEDAQNGHIYAPLDWLAEMNLSQIMVATNQPGTVQLAHRLVAAAKPYYRSAFYGAMRLPFRSAWAIMAALYIYRDIGKVIRRARHRLPARATTSKFRKTLRVAQAFLTAAYGVLLGRHLPAPPRRDRPGDLWQRPH